MPKGTLAQGLETKAYTAGSTYPTLKDGTVRLYSMRFCPYSERALVAMSVKNVPHEIVNISLAKKPEWFLEDKNPTGKLPTMEHDGKIVYESLIVAEYADGLYPSSGKRLLPSDPYKKAEQKILVERLGQLATAMYVTYLDSTNLPKVMGALKLASELLTEDFYGGSEPSWADYMTWPWFERLPIIEHLSEGALKIETGYPKLASYIKRMLALPEIDAVVRDGDVHIGFIKTFIAGGNAAADFDFGIPSA